MGGPVAPFYLAKVLWTKPTKIIHSAGEPESNLGILIMYILILKFIGVYDTYSLYTRLACDLPFLNVQE